MEASHLNDIPTDNRLVNLKWDTHRGNCKQQLINGKYATGVAHHSSKLTADKVRWIRNNYPSLTMQEMALQLNVTKQAVWRVLHGKSWSHV
jgi:hypothetical protein